MNLFSNLDPLKRFSEQYNQRTKLTISLSIFGVIIFILIAAMLPFKDKLFNYLYPKPKSQAQEIKQDQKPPKPEYTKGEVLVKFRTPTSLEVKKEKKNQGIDLDKAAVTFPDLEERSIPPVIENIHQKYKVKQIEKVFKGAGSPQEELTKFKKKFASEIAAGKRKINESELLKIDLSRTFKLIFEDDTIPIEQLIQELAQNPEIEYAEPNFIFRTQQKGSKKPKPTPTPLPTPTPTPTPIPTPTPTPLPCTLTSASWSTATAVEGSGVGLDVAGTSCAGKTVSFEVRRFGSTPLDDIPANIQPTPVVLNAFGQGSGTWIAEYNPLLPGTDPDYYFKATVLGGNTIDNKTALLTVTQAPTPAPIPSGPTPTPTATPTRTSLWPNDPYYPQMWNLSKIKMEDGWKITKGSKDVTIAVVDTGIDYTHQELGETIVSERSFEQITKDPITLFFPSSTRASQTLALNQNRIAYYSNDKIYIYSFDTATTEVINMPATAPNPQVIRLALKDNILVYSADYNRSDYYSRPEYYLYNLTTREYRQISDFYSTKVVPFEITDGKVVWTGGAHVYIYDIQTGVTSVQSNPNTFSFQYISYLKASGNLVAYSLHSVDTPCYQAIVIHNIDTDQRQRFYPPNIGPVMDYRDNKVLYRACYANGGYNRLAFYIFDVTTGQTQELSYSLGNSAIGGETKAAAFIIWVFSMIDEGAFGDGVIFLSKNSSGESIIAFDQKSNKYVEINILKAAYNFAAEGKRICFVSSDSRIYCHMYDTNYDYPPPPQSYFNNKVVSGYNFIENNNNPIDRYGHGTHVAGTIGASVNNGVGISGMNWDISLMAVKVLDDSGSGTTDNIAKGVIYAADNGARVINMSLGGEFPCSQSQAFQDAIFYAKSRGLTVVVAAGNSNIDASNFSPASCQGVITVAATGPTDDRAYYSNYGSVVDLAAPGGDSLKCTDNISCLINSTYPDNQYRFFQGTSMATPHVTGLAALMLTINPTLASDQVETILRETGDSLVTDQSIGNIINAHKALLSANPTPTPTPIPTPTPSLGLSISPSSVNVTGTSGSIVKVFDLTSTGANSFQFYGYPTSYGPGINWTPQSGGITTGSTMPINIEVMTTVSAGTYQGTGTLMNLQGQQMSIPVTINVVQPTPTPTPIPTPVPRTYKYVFLTSATYNGNLGNLTGADQKCQTLANNVSKLSSSTFMAWLSNSSNSPNSRFLTKSSQAYMLVEDTTKIADNWTDLTDNSIDAPINKDENGNTVAAGSEVWTNTSASGGIVNIATDSNCNNWTTDDGLNYGVYVGANNYSSNTWWTIYNYRTCNGTRRLYCFEQ